MKYLIIVFFLLLSWTVNGQEAPFIQWEPTLEADQAPAWMLFPPSAAEAQQLDWLLASRKLTVDTRLGASMALRAKHPDLYFYLLFLSFFVLAVLVRRNPQYFKNMWGAAFNFRLMMQFVREQVGNITAFSIIYVLIFNLLLALFLAELVYQRESIAWISSPSWAVFLAFGVVCMVYVGKYFFYKFLGLMLGMREQVNFYLTEVFLLNRVTLLFFLPLLALMFYGNELLSPWGMYASLALLAGSLIWRYTNAARMISKMLFAHSFHFILYFCAVEIIPTAVIAKFLLNV